MRTGSEIQYCLGVTRVGATATASMLDKAKKLISQGVDLESYGVEV